MTYTIIQTGPSFTQFFFVGIFSCELTRLSLEYYVVISWVLQNIKYQNDKKGMTVNLKLCLTKEPIIANFT